MAYLLVVVLVVAAVLGLQAGLSRRERVWIAYGFAVHLAGTAALLWLHVTRGSDMDGYGPHGMRIADLVRSNVVRWGPELVKVILRRESALPVATGSTGAMDGLSAIVFLVLGDGLFPACVAVSTFALSGQVLLYRFARRYVSEGERFLAAAAAMFVPSVAVWGGGLVKEAFCIGGLGIAIFCIDRVFDRRFGYVVPLAFGVVIIVAVKPYVLFPLILAVGAWIFSAQTGGRVRAIYAVFGVVVAIAGVAAMSRLFPEFAVDKLGESLAHQRYHSQMAGGGSLAEVEVEDIYNPKIDTSLTGQLKYLPLAMVNALFRPFLFEVRNAPQLAAGLESTIILVIALGLVRRIKVRRLLDSLTSTPLLFASATFVVCFAASVGLASHNLGTLSRYRVPMMPMYALVLLLLRERIRVPGVVQATGAERGASLRGERPGPSSRGHRALARARDRRSLAERESVAPRTGRGRS